MTSLVLLLLAQHFEPLTLASDLKGGYQVLAVDLNRDGRPDLIGLGQAMDRLDWFENPGAGGTAWRRHTLLNGLNQPINVAALDLDGDGRMELLLAHEFSSAPGRSKGIVSLLRSGEDPRQAWTRRDIDALPTSHRLKVAGGCFINAPLANAQTSPPEYRGAIPLVAYCGPDAQRRVLNEEDSGVMHGLNTDDFNGDGRTDLLTASFNGIALLTAGKNGKYRRRLLHAGHAQPWPKSGSSDVAVARTGKKKFLGAIEPWHGNEFVIYTQQGKSWKREVLEAGLSEGHTVLAADLDGDGAEEIVYGSRKGQVTLRYARYDRGRREWKTTTILDGPIATSSCVSADFNQDGRKDLACIGGATQNLVVLTNRP
ncbi:MAG: FG-GAP repeat domain-containing protein [Acidobacteriota bacterium]